jgi:hypothetical protein
MTACPLGQRPLLFRARSRHLMVVRGRRAELAIGRSNARQRTLIAWAAPGAQ